MCNICDKVDFAITTLESLFPEVELLETYKDIMQSKDVPDKPNGEPYTEADIKASTHGNFILTLAVRYAIKQNLPPYAFMELSQLIFSVEYGRESAMRIIKQATGSRPDEEQCKMKSWRENYES